MEYKAIMTFNLVGGLVLLGLGHWPGLISATIGAAGFVVNIYVQRRDRRNLNVRGNVR